MKTLTLVLFLATPSTVLAAEVPQALAIRAIVGEAENQGFEGLLAVAEAIRTRGSLKGVYGAKRDISKAPKSVIKEAERAWEVSKDTTTAKGADVWGTESDVRKFRKTRWFKSYRQVAKINDHFFFKQIV
jgi:hypothetical protein